MKFTELGLAEPFLRALEKLGYEEATPIQAAAIPMILAGRDVIGCAQTGTGKTAAFTLPMLDRLLQTLPPKPEGHKPEKPKHKGPKGSKGANPRPRVLKSLVLSPTRELAAQISESLKKYGRHTPLRHCVVFGGVSQLHQVRALRHGVDSLVATPGRLLDLIGQGHIDLSQIEILVFDEADQMLDMGFLPDLKRIVSMVPEERQTLMFSATMPTEIRRLAEQWLTDPESVEVAPVATPAERIAQSVRMVEKKEKPDELARFLKETPRSRTLVFSRTKHGADKIVKRLERDGLRAAAIHGNKSQGARTRTLERFKGKNPPILVATDIAARGLDIRDVSHIVNYDLPEAPETYVHRIGRTARAGAEGVAISYCARDERRYLFAIERLMKTRIAVHGENGEELEPARPMKEQSHSNRQQNGGQGGGRPQRGGNSSRPKRKRPFRKSGQFGGSGGQSEGRRGERSGERGPRSEYGQRSERSGERDSRSECGQRSERGDRGQRGENGERTGQRGERTDRNDRGPRGENGERTERGPRNGKPGGKPGFKSGFKSGARSGGKPGATSRGNSSGGGNGAKAGGRPGGKPGGKPGAKSGAKAGGKPWGNKGKFKSKGRKPQTAAN
ncbi:DEAD/DEAH box helicase [Aeoliella mucimassa]|uniref:DEAD-box ATP-dependent RNA helicase RhpA n=1 Tax=Aeoliella mucimassa TaxID=2527972 RepID=A0A518ATU7_9BACT|nr:DEAD/DEAH box helicase [Aeoliella mucimassa]QDU58150.1 ATP-dependent RNA helicase RhlE [Aeoliella mucimassa]